jgi:hypothetical protein
MDDQHAEIMQHRCGWGIALACVCCALWAADTAAGQDQVVTYVDPGRDALLRRTDPGGDGPTFPELHPSVELLSITIGAWTPASALYSGTDVFDGAFDCNGQFFRLDVVFDGLVNPPGETDPTSFNPFEMGDNPVFGFIEIDMDRDVETGGELVAPQFRYLANAARFGGKPSRADFADRVATDTTSLDGDFGTPPFIERHGEEFHIAFIESAIGDDMTVLIGDSDDTFEEGEVWALEGDPVHRAHGYEEFSLIRDFEADSWTYFAHDAVEDVTTVSFVFPMLDDPRLPSPCGTPLDSALCDTEGEESILGGLCDLRRSAQFIRSFPTGDPAEAIILGWEDKSPTEFVDTSQWNITAIFGTSYTSPSPTGEVFAWTDIYPNVVRGDVDGDGVWGDSDVVLIEAYIVQTDGADGVVDDQAVVVGFADAFTVLDVNQDGLVDDVDILLVSVPGDHDGDLDVDLLDFGRFQVCFLGQITRDDPECVYSDLDLDLDIDIEDFARLRRIVTLGPDE